MHFDLQSQAAATSVSEAAGKYIMSVLDIFCLLVSYISAADCGLSLPSLGVGQGVGGYDILLILILKNPLIIKPSQTLISPRN